MKCARLVRLRGDWEMRREAAKPLEYNPKSRKAQSHRSWKLERSQTLLSLHLTKDVNLDLTRL